MIEPLLDTLHRERLDSPTRIDRAILHDRSLTNILDLLSGLCASIEDLPVKPASRVEPFVFFPNSNITAQHWPCAVLPCRLQRADRLARFAALWADSVYIPFYPGRHLHDHPTQADDWLRWEVATDLKVLLSLSPVLRAGIAHFFNPSFYYCPHCDRDFSQRLQSLESTLDRAKADLRKQIVGAVTVRVHTPPLDLPHQPLLMLDLEGPEDVLPHGSRVAFLREQETLPSWLPQAVRRRAMQGQPFDYVVPRSKLPHVEPIELLLDLVAGEILVQHILSASAGAAYLTDRRVDAAFLTAIDASPEKAALNAVLEQYLSYDMPVIETVPLREILRLRRAEDDAFVVYRDTMTRLIRDHLPGRGTISATEARDIYDAEVRPALNKLNARMGAVRSSLSDKFRRNVAVSATILSLGFFGGLSGVVPQDAGAIFSAFGGAGLAKEVLDSLLKAVRPPEDLRGDNLYFLWKLGKRQS